MNGTRRKGPFTLRTLTDVNARWRALPF